MRPRRPALLLRLHDRHGHRRVHQLPHPAQFCVPQQGQSGKTDRLVCAAFCIITCIVNSINCIWVAVAGLLVPDFIYNIGTTVLNGGISMVIFFFVNKIIFPEGEKAAK